MELGTGTPNLPAIFERRRAIRNLGVTPPDAAFLSQLLAERQHSMVQRARRRAPLADALALYDKGLTAATVRMPSGYRKTLIV